MTEPLATSADDLVDTFGIDPTIYHRRRQILAVLCLSLVIIVMSVSSLNVAIPTIIERLHATSTEMLWIIEAYALVFAGALLPAGALGDRWGRKWTLLLGLGIFATMAAVAGFSGGPGQLIAARAVMGIGAAFIMPATLSIITNVFPPHERGKAIATWAGFAGAGGALGPLLSGTVLRLVSHEHWGFVFFINIPLALLLIGLVWFLVPNSKDPAGHPIDPVGALLSVVALGSLVFGIIEAPHWGWTSPGVLLAFGTSIVFGVLFIVVELRLDHPMLDPRLMRYRGFSMGALTITMAFFCMFGMFLMLTQYLQFVKGYTPLDAAVRQLPGAAMMVLLAPRSPAVAKKLGMKNLIRLGLVLMAIGFLGLSRAHVDTQYWFIAICLMVLSSGMALVMAPTSATVVSSLPLSKAGVGSAVNDVTREVGGAVGIAVLGSLLTTGYGNKMRPVLEPFQQVMPAAARKAAADSIQGAFGVADRAPTPALGDMLRSHAKQAFVSGVGNGYLAAVAVALAAFIVIPIFMPNHPPMGERLAPETD